MKNSTWLYLSCLTGAAAIAACSSSTTTGGTQATSDGGTGGQSAGASSTSAASTSSGTTAGSGGATTSSSGATTSSSSGGSTLVNGCDPALTTVSPGNVTIAFPTGLAPSQYAPPCVKVHEGATVTWNGSFTDHPLAPDGTGNPIMSTSAGATATFTFAAAGSFGFHCAMHPLSMLGAVFVVP